ncbi:PREDICTED: potassium transporter 2 [Prunus mume]|uniref:Potassium transporter n=1 Tax=Prunus mume TaxID=102107 RepID=A0ABM1LUU9_PRUMU|nr:PREDICTED: potassium transporter 2 [Prunus mume]XP_016651176.1 PREDICTED: potassium transporter 2 [Prunus mume]
MDPQLGSSNQFKETWKHTLLLSFQSLGVIYGQLSTAPLYVFGTMIAEDIKSEETVYELFSCIFWTITIISLLKYAFIVLRADDNGEGGTFALYSLLCRHAKVGLLPNDTSANEVMHYETGSPFKIKVESRARRAIEKHKSSHYLMLFLALFGSCMTIGVGVLTPALSVYSVSSGVQRSMSDMAHLFSSSPRKQEAISNAFEKYVPVPMASAILVCLFTLQHYGTHKIGFIFAPIIVIWLIFIGGGGIYNIFHWNKQIIHAVSPMYMYRFVKNIEIKSWRSLGSIVLCVAGSEAMFADLGHFRKKSIKITFVCLIYPVLVLCYAGQAAYISKNLHVADFNHLSESIPHRIRHWFIALSLLASVVGSQATITASFSIINQCLALGCFPRVKVIHTSDKIHGQVYIPDINWLLMVLSLAVTIGFHDIMRIGSATGLAVISGMLVTTCLMSLVIALYWEKNLFESVCCLIFFGSIEVMYVSACMLNFHKGAWYLVVLLALSLTVMLSWHYGTKKKLEFDLQNKVSAEWLTDISPGLGVTRVPGIGFIYTDIVTGIPAFFSHFITNIPAFHQVLIFVSFKSLPMPYVPASRRYLIGRVGPKDLKIYRCVVRYGYCDPIRDTDNFEEQIISSIGEFITMEENEFESLNSSEGRMVVVGKPPADGSALIPLNETNSVEESVSLVSNIETQLAPMVADAVESGLGSVMRKKVRFMLPANSPKMRASVRDELQELIDARESGTAYFLGQVHLAVRDGSDVLKRLLIMTYAFCDKNCREPPVALNIPHAALVEVGMVCCI